MTTETSTTTSNTTDNGDGIYARIGCSLRERREELEMSQRDVAERLHLPGLVIDDLENGRVERLSGIYRRGYVCNYARLLGLDPDSFMAELRADEPPELRQVMPGPSSEWRLEKYLKIATYVLVTTAIVPPLLYFFIEGGSRIMERDVTAADSTAGSHVEGASLAETSERIARLLTRSEVPESPADRASHVSASALPLTGNRATRQSVLLPQAEPVASDQPQAEQETGLADGLSEMSLVLSDDSWIEIHAADGSRLEYDLLRAGQTRSYRGEPPFELLLGRASAVRITIDGRPVSWEGQERGDVTQFRLTAEGEVRR